MEGYTDIVVQAAHSKVFFETSEPRISDIRSVQETEEIEKRQEWQERPVDFPGQPAVVLRIKAEILRAGRCRFQVFKFCCDILAIQVLDRNLDLRSTHIAD